MGWDKLMNTEFAIKNCLISLVCVCACKWMCVWLCEAISCSVYELRTFSVVSRPSRYILVVCSTNGWYRWRRHCFDSIEWREQKTKHAINNQQRSMRTENDVVNVMNNKLEHPETTECLSRWYRPIPTATHHTNLNRVFQWGREMISRPSLFPDNVILQVRYRFHHRICLARKSFIRPQRYLLSLKQNHFQKKKIKVYSKKW